MSKAVADGIDLVDAGDHAPLGVGEELENQGDGLIVAGHGVVLFVSSLTGALMGDDTGQTDLLAQTLGQNLLLIHIEKLILQGRASGVDNQDFHGIVFSFYMEF